MAHFNRAVLQAALRSRSLSEDTLRQRTGYTASQFADEIERGPNQSLVSAISKELSVPSFMFYMTETPAFENNILDFRHPDPRATAKSRATIESIQIAYSIQREAAQLGYLKDSKPLPQIRASLDELNQTAARIREFFEISIEDQIAAKDQRIFYYLCRKKIEEKNIFVLQESFPREDGSGFALWDEHCPVIIVNTFEQHYSRRLFTLIHELAHVLLRQTGISDPFVRRNSTERYCNAFAAEFLVPANKLNTLLQGETVPRNPTTDQIRRIARRLKISQEATIIRLEQLGRVVSGSHENWLTAISNLGNPDYKNSGGGNGRAEEEKIKFARYGFLFAKIFERALQERRITDIGLFRIAGIKPKWLKDFFQYARTVDFEGVEE